MSAAGRTKVGVRWAVSGLEKMMDFYNKTTGKSVFTVEDSGLILPTRTIYGALIAGQSVQELDTVPTTTQKHDLGSRMVTVDGDVYRYFMAGGTLNSDLGAVPQYTQEVGYNTIAASAIVGAKTIAVDMGASDGIAENGVIAVNYLKGGRLLVFPHSENSFTRRIIANTVTTGAGEMTLTLDTGIPHAITVDVDHMECMASPYKNVITSTSGQKSVVVVPTSAMTIGMYGWGQTWGICWLAPQGAVATGTNDRQVVFRHDSSVDQHDSDDANVELAQHAGFILKDIRGGGQGAPFIMLQISP